MARGADDVITDQIALVQFQPLPMPHVVRVIAPFPDGASAELWAIEHGYLDYVLAPLALLRGRNG